MALRTANNPTTDVVILGVLASVMLNDVTTGLPNTQIGLNQSLLSAQRGKPVSLVFIQNKYQMSLGNFPAIHLSAGPQSYRKNSLRTYMGQMTAIIEYYDRWDQQPNTIDAVRAGIAPDLERIKANIEENDSLVYQGQANAISVPQMSLSPYKGEFDFQFEGKVLVYRTLTLSINILPYDALS